MMQYLFDRHIMIPKKTRSDISVYRSQINELVSEKEKIDNLILSNNEKQNKFSPKKIKSDPKVKLLIKHLNADLKRFVDEKKKIEDNIENNQQILRRITRGNTM